MFQNRISRFLREQLNSHALVVDLQLRLLLGLATERRQLRHVSEGFTLLDHVYETLPRLIVHLPRVHDPLQQSVIRLLNLLALLYKTCYLSYLSYCLAWPV